MVTKMEYKILNDPEKQSEMKTFTSLILKVWRFGIVLRRAVNLGTRQFA